MGTILRVDGRTITQNFPILPHNVRSISYWVRRMRIGNGFVSGLAAPPQVCTMDRHWSAAPCVISIDAEVKQAIAHNIDIAVRGSIPADAKRHLVVLLRDDKHFGGDKPFYKSRERA